MKIDKEFAGLIPPLTEEEYRGLEASIVADGCRDALVCWGDILVDGHNRYRICEEHGIEYETVRREFAGRDEVLLWIMRNQLSRRNLNDFQRIEIVRKCENAVKEQAEQRMLAGKSDPSINLRKGRATDELGIMAGVSASTYEHATAIIDNAPEPVKEAVRKQELSINAGYEATKLPPEKQAEIATRIESGEKPKDAVKSVLSEMRPRPIEVEPEEIVQPVKSDEVKRPHVSYNTGNSEWYTPLDYIELAREVMGSIDLDPASTETAQRIVKAETYYTQETNGLSHEWFGNVWLNPPYASELIVKFVDKLISELENIKQAIILVNNATETEWFNRLADGAMAVCFPKGRVRFYAPDGSIGTPLQGQALLYFGEYENLFVDKFRRKGWCALLQ